VDPRNAYSANYPDSSHECRRTFCSPVHGFQATKFHHAAFVRGYHGPIPENFKIRRQQICVCDLVLMLVEREFLVSLDDLKGSSRGFATICEARQICMYLLHTSFSFTYSEVGALLARDRTTVSHGCAVVEDLRDNIHLDQKLTSIERLLERVREMISEPMRLVGPTLL